MAAKIRFLFVSPFLLSTHKKTYFYPMKILMYFAFYLFKIVLKPGLRLYHRRTQIQGKKHLRKRGPCILAANHPATILDPLNAAAVMPRPVYFLANAGLFASPFGKWFFGTFFCIPVQRYEDTGGKPLQNEQSFAAARQFLAEGGCLFIAPESTSLPAYHLRKLKTGAARIGLQTEAEHDFQLDLVLQPVGLNYDNTRKFRSRLFLNIGEPLPFAPYQQQYLENPRAAVRAYTDELQKQMGQLLLDTRDEEEEELIPLAREIVRGKKQLSPKEEFFKLQQALKKWHRLRDQSAEQWSAFRQTMKNYEQRLREWQINHRALLRQHIKPANMLLLLLGALPALYGWLNNLLPVTTLCRLSRKLNQDPSYDPTYKFGIALIAFPLFYALQIWAFAKWAPLSIAWHGYELSAWLYFASLIPAGIFYEWYAERLRDFRALLRYQKLLSRQPIELAELHQMRLEVEKYH